MSSLAANNLVETS